MRTLVTLLVTVAAALQRHRRGVQRRPPVAFGAGWSALSSAAVLAVPAVRAVTWRPPRSGERPGS